MGIDKNTSYGKINISLEAIALVADKQQQPVMVLLDFQVNAH